MNAIDIKNFSFHYPDGTAALNHVSLSIAHGEKVVLIGPNGAGKSSLLLAMAGFAQGTGSVHVDGLEVAKKNLKAIRRVLGCCLENPDDQLFMPSLFEDIAFGPLNMGLAETEITQRVTQALATVGLEDKAHKPPHHLSAGQKRAAAIATVLSMAPKIITLDEPDGSLDPRHRIKLQSLLKSLTQTLIVATCNMNFAYAIADRILLVDQGQIVADGSRQTIMTNQSLLEEHGLELPTL
jgi:cobalt/nickel transport system ATP-binding protein